jgi:hypothetical protein
MNFDTFEKFLGSELPDAYKAYLIKGANDRFLAEDKKWRLYSYEELLEGIVFSGRSMPTYQILGGHMDDLKEFKPSLVPEVVQPSLAIGEDNGDILFFDVECRVHAFLHSSLEFVPIADCFEGLLKSKVGAQRDEAVETPPIIGHWVAVSSETTDMKSVYDLFPMYVFNVDGTCRVDFTDPETNEIEETEEYTWRSIHKSGDSKPCIQVGECKFYIDAVDDSHLTLSNEARDLIITYTRNS